jgi:chromosome segregation ATPase
MEQELVAAITALVSAVLASLATRFRMSKVLAPSDRELESIVATSVTSHLHGLEQETARLRSQVADLTSELEVLRAQVELCEQRHSRRDAESLAREQLLEELRAEVERLRGFHGDSR